MTRTREAVVAGTFYPASARVLAEMVDELLAEASSTVPPESRSVDPSSLRGMVVPHAGYVYSGPVAATAYALLPTLPKPPSCLVILGPSHFEPVRGLAVAPNDAWSTPLGEVALDDGARAALVAGGAHVDDLPHRSEHSIEVQLPFLQRCLPGVPVLPVAVGMGLPEAGAQVLAEAMPGDALLVVSTDLSHYHDAVTAERLDARTARAIGSLDLDALRPEDACGADALRVALAWARDLDLQLRTLDLRTSAATVGDPSRVVGYGAFAIVEKPLPTTT